ncbi:hypothetical protein [Fictibacillus barbaricus]|uniref:hypothetical protein n=1 Tax=Fictibacillus barbaricus TaxID=182136 RepID=UPI00166336BB|nr:hypothetical protein [Fictibacillus barbaricus]GGB43340.1 hypothetical protein GCM10007199_05800 [Fictibacillus barbaricus]
MIAEEVDITDNQGEPAYYYPNYTNLTNDCFIKVPYSEEVHKINAYQEQIKNFVASEVISI